MNVEAARHLIRNRNFSTEDAARSCTNSENEYQEMFAVLKNEGLSSRKQAALEGKTRYFTGKPCNHGHVVERYTSIGTCVECTRLHAKKQRNFYKEARAKLITITVSVHPEDSQLIEDLATALNTGRMIKS